MDWLERAGWVKRYADREMEARLEELKGAGLDPKSLPGYMLGVAIAYTGHFLHGLFKDRSFVYGLCCDPDAPDDRKNNPV